MNHKEELKKLLKTVKVYRQKEGKPSRNEDLALELGYTRSYFSTLLGESGKVTEDHIRTFKAHYRKELENQTSIIENIGLTRSVEDFIGDHEERLLRIESHLEVYEATIAALLSKEPSDFATQVGKLREQVKGVVNRRLDELRQK